MVATRNRCPELRRTLRLLCDLPESPEVIVVDNGSTDQTRRMVRTEFPVVTLVGLRRNIGAAARNVGVRLAQTPYVAFADDDSWWEPGSLELAAQTLAAHPQVALLAAHITVQPQGTEDPVCAQMAAAAIGWPEELPGPRILGYLACAAVVRRDAFLAVGGFSRLLGFGGEEQLVSVDLVTAGWQLCYLAALRVHHHPSLARQRPARRWALHQRNDLLTAWLRRPWPMVRRATADLLRQAPANRPAARAAVEVALRLPLALARRSRLPEAVEADLRRLELLGGRS